MQRLLNLPWRALPAWLVGNRLKILMYHSISDNSRDPHALTPQEFQRQMEFLQTKHVVSLLRALELLAGSSSLRDIYVITFDDALLDFYAQALPILRKFGYPATMFVPTGLVGRQALWDTHDNSKPLMNWEQLRACSAFNVTFASHTVSHARLTECSDADLRSELEISLQTLRSELGEAVPALAYPGGYYDARVRGAVRAAGYTCALTASSRWGNGPESDFLQLRRQRLTA